MQEKNNGFTLSEAGTFLIVPLFALIKAQNMDVNSLQKNAYISIREEGKDLIRGAAGGLIFGTPLLFTMEMWYHGVTFSSGHLLGLLALVGVINLVFSYASGLRAMHEGHSLVGAIPDMVTSLALGLVIATIVLALIGHIPGDGMEASLRKIIIEGAVISIGVTFTNTKFPRQNAANDEKSGAQINDPLSKSDLSLAQKQTRDDLENLAAVIGGALVFTFNIAPTEEVTLLATTIPPYTLLLLFFSEIVICYIILFAANFKEHKIYKDNIMQHPYAEVAITVAASFLVAALLLCLVSYDHVLASTHHFAASVVVLALPAVVGGSAGRLVV